MSWDRIVLAPPRLEFAEHAFFFRITTRMDFGRGVDFTCIKPMFVWDHSWLKSGPAPSDCTPHCHVPQGLEPSTLDFNECASTAPSKVGSKALNEVYVPIAMHNDTL